MTEANFIGKEVVVTNKWGCYPFYSSWVKKQTGSLYFYQAGIIPNENDTGRVVAAGLHKKRGVKLYLILIGNQVYVMEEESFKLKIKKNS